MYKYVDSSRRVVFAVNSVGGSDGCLGGSDGHGANYYVKW